jgi:hypothetical protein
MSHLYQHLLIPPSPEFVPNEEMVENYFEELKALQMLPIEPNFKTLVFTGRERLVATNPRTREKCYGPEFNVHRFTELNAAANSVGGQSAYDFSVEGKGSVSVQPFNLYSGDNYASQAPGNLWSGEFSYSINCRLRSKSTHFLHSPKGCKCKIHTDERAVFKIPWSDKSIRTPGPASARFWIEFSVGEYLMPRIKNSLEILNQQLYAVANRVFGICFIQGCRVNDD